MKTKIKYEAFGRLIKKSRLSLGLTQKQFAKELKVHFQYISNCERGLCRLPLRALKRIHHCHPFSKDEYCHAFVIDVLHRYNDEVKVIFKKGDINGKKWNIVATGD